MKYLFLFIILSILYSCSSLPVIHPVSPSLQKTLSEQSLTIFPKGKWQLVHSIEAIAPTGEKAVLTGVSVFSDDPVNLKCILMTVEGFVLFEGMYQSVITINRALPPFDKPGFAEGLIDDVRLLFEKPEVLKMTVGQYDDHTGVCRYKDSKGYTTDIAMKPDKSWNLYRYNPKYKLMKSITATYNEPVKKESGYAFPEKYTLITQGLFGYTLNMTLIDAFHDNQQ